MMKNYYYKQNNACNVKVIGQKRKEIMQLAYKRAMARGQELDIIILSKIVGQSVIS